MFRYPRRNAQLMRAVRPVALVGLLALLAAVQPTLTAGASHAGASAIPIRPAPAMVRGRFLQISSGWNFACGLRMSGKATCWGDDTAANGHGPKVPAGSFTHIVAGDGFACAQRSSGAVVCWVVGIEHPGGIWKSPSGTFSQISASSFDLCGLSPAGADSCWANTDLSGSPSGTFTQVAAGGGFACGLRAGGAVICWNSGGNTKSNPGSPSGSFTQVSAGYAFACGLRTNGTVSCWGSDGIVPPSGTFSDVSVGAGFACAVRRTGAAGANRALCWGTDTHVEPGPPAGSFTQVSAGAGLACGVRTNGKGVCWAVLTSATSVPLPTRPVAAVKGIACFGMTDGRGVRGCPAHLLGYVSPCFRGAWAEPEWSPLLGCPVTNRLSQRLISFDSADFDVLCRCQVGLPRKMTFKVRHTAAGRRRVNVGYDYGRHQEGALFTEAYVAVKRGKHWLVADAYCAGKPNTTIYGTNFGPCG